MKTQSFKILDPIEDIFDLSDEALFKSDRRAGDRDSDRRLQYRPTLKLKFLGLAAAVIAFGALAFACSL